MFPGIVFWDTATKWESRKCVCLNLCSSYDKIPEDKYTELFHVSIFKLYCFPKIVIDFFQNILILFPSPLCKQTKTWGKWLAENSTADGPLCVAKHCTSRELPHLWKYITSHMDYDASAPTTPPLPCPTVGSVQN